MKPNLLETNRNGFPIATVAAKPDGANYQWAEAQAELRRIEAVRVLFISILSTITYLDETELRENIETVDGIIRYFRGNTMPLIAIQNTGKWHPLSNFETA